MNRILNLLLLTAVCGLAQPSKQWTELAKDMSGARRGSAIRYASKAGAFFLWGFLNDDPEALQENRLIKIPEYDMVFFDPAAGRWANHLPLEKQAEWSKQLPMGMHPGIYSGITTGSRRTLMRGEAESAEGVPRPTLNIVADQVAYRSRDNSLLYFTGGLTAAYDIERRVWKDLKPPHSPPPVLGGSLAYDARRDEMILFGGGHVAEGSPVRGYTGTWVFSYARNDWSQLTLGAQPPPRMNTRMVADTRNNRLVLFGGDGQKAYLADTWIFELVSRTWRASTAPGPPPRAGHFTVFDPQSGLVMIGGGYNREDLRDMWAYDAAADKWRNVAGETPTGFYISADIAPEQRLILLTTDTRRPGDTRGCNALYPVRTTYGYRIDTATMLRDAAHTRYAPMPKREALETNSVPVKAPDLRNIPVNRWVHLANPGRVAPLRTWGTATFDTDRGAILYWGGEHCGYSGSDVDEYLVDQHTWRGEREPEYPGRGFDKGVALAGVTFSGAPFTVHGRKIYAYDPVSKRMIIVRPLNLTDGYQPQWTKAEKSDCPQCATFSYDPVRQTWERKASAPFGVTALVTTPRGVIGATVAWRGRLNRAGYITESGQASEDNPLYLFEAAKNQWTRLGPPQVSPGNLYEMTSLAYDTRREQVILHGGGKNRDEVWTFDLKTKRWRNMQPKVVAPEGAAAPVCTRESVYIPSEDVVLIYGSAIWEYSVGENVWRRVEIPQMTEVPVRNRTSQNRAMVYDAKHDLVLLVLGANGGDNGLAAVFAMRYRRTRAGASLRIPAVAAAVTVDGKLDEPLWGEARSLPFGAEAKVAVCGAYLCLGARVPEAGRVIAMSTGVSPTWWREDLLVWNFATNYNNRGRRVALTVNPFGAYDAGGMKGVMATARVGGGEWTMEAAIPLSELAPIGFLSLERIRAPRADAPELRWQWPAQNERMDFELAGALSGYAPVFEPVRLPMPVRESQQTYLTDQAEPATNLRKRMAEAAAAERLEWQKVKTRGDWERFRDQRIGALRKSFGPFPERTPLRAAVTRRVDYGDGFVIENVVYESMPGRLVPANLYLPAKSGGARWPVVVVAHSHHAPKTQSELQDMGMTWARAGVAVLVPDQPGAGERVESQAWPRESYYSRYAMGMQLYLTGESLMKWAAWDLMRGIDMLLERPQIDPKRIVMLGAVAGGGDPAAVLAALDSRVAAVIPFNFGEAGPEEHYTSGPRPYDFETADPGWGFWESTRGLRRSAADQFFPWLICASVAPRPFLFSFEIGWPKTVEEEPAWARYKKVFELYGARDHLADVDGFGPFPGPGECTNVGSFLRRRIYPVLKRWLAFPIPASEYHNVRPEADLMAITPELAAERKPKPTAELARALAVQRLARARVRMNPAALRSALAAKLGDIEPGEPGISLPVILKPARGTGPTPAVLAFAQDGTKGFQANRAAEIERLLEHGIAVCLADVRGVGRKARGPGAMGPAANELMLGNTLLGARLKDARTLFRYLASRPEIDPKRIALWGDSFGAVKPRDMVFDKSANQPGGPEIPQAEPLGPLLALLTALYEPDVAAVATRRGLTSFLSVLDDRFTYVPLDVIVPGILEAGDIPDIVAAIGPRPVLMQAPVDGRNRPVSANEDAGAGVIADWISATMAKVAQDIHCCTADRTQFVRLF